jgi:outer membrane protein
VFRIEVPRLVCLIAIAVLGLTPVQGKAAGLADTVEAVLSNNPTLSAARAAVRATSEGIAQARAALRPRVGATIEADAAQQLPLVPNAGQTTLGAALTIEQPLFQGLAGVKGVRVAELELLAAREELRGLEQDVLLEAIRAHADLWRDRAIVELAHESLRLAQEQLEEQQAQGAGGEGVRTEEAQSRAQVAVAESRYARSLADAEAAAAEYQRLTGLEPSQIDLGNPDVRPPSTSDGAVRIALDENPSIRVASIRYDIAMLEIDIARSEMMPTAGVFATVGANRDVGAAGNWTNEATIGLRITIPLYAGGGPMSTVRQAEHQLAQLEGNRLVQRAAVESQVRSAYANWQANTERVDLAYQLLFALLVAQDTVEEGAKAGVATSIEVMRAKQEVLSAQTSLIQARRDEVVALYVLMATIGRLNADAIGIGD